MSLETEPCGSCSTYNRGLSESKKYMKAGDVTGIGRYEFFLEKMIGYPVDSDIAGVVKEICLSCKDHKSIYDKAKLGELKENLDILQFYIETFPDERKPEVLKKGMLAVDAFIKHFEESAKESEDPYIISVE